MARDNLERQGFELYLPLATIMRQHRGRSRPGVAPLFPRYLFIHLNDETHDWKPIRSTLGVQQLVSFGGIPAMVPANLIKVLKEGEDSEGLQHLPVSLTPDPGEGIRISQGPFKGYEAIFQARTSHDRVVVLLQLLERTLRVEIEAGAIERL